MATLTTKYKGYSTIGTSFTKPVLVDFDLAKQDLLNQFGTKLGERIMLPTHDNTRQLIRDDVVRIISEDPRWEFVEVQTVENEHSVNVDVTLIYRPEKEVTTLPLEFNKGEF